MFPLAKSLSCQVRVSPAGARLVPLISTHVLGAIVGLSPSALATLEMTGALDAAGRVPVGLPTEIGAIPGRRCASTRAAVTLNSIATWISRSAFLNAVRSKTQSRTGSATAPPHFFLAIVTTGRGTPVDAKPLALLRDTRILLLRSARFDSH